ncbi:hypothetical protein AOX63_22935 [Pseudomonas sp. ADP]|nr:hypothetical protein AOX63_22935 [Pseudomonas sp. ADP]
MGILPLTTTSFSCFRAATSRSLASSVLFNWVSETARAVCWRVFMVVLPIGEGWTMVERARSGHAPNSVSEASHMAIRYGLTSCLSILRQPRPIRGRV